MIGFIDLDDSVCQPQEGLSIALIRDSVIGGVGGCPQRRKMGMDPTRFVQYCRRSAKFCGLAELSKDGMGARTATTSD